MNDRIGGSQRSHAEPLWDRVRQIAVRGYGDGIDMLACIAVLVRGNEQSVTDGINMRGADRTALLIRNALFGRLHLTTMQRLTQSGRGTSTSP